MDKRPLLYIFVSDALFGISPRLAKLLVKDIPPVVLAGLTGFQRLWSLQLIQFDGVLPKYLPGDRQGVFPGDFASCKNLHMEA